MNASARIQLSVETGGRFCRMIQSDRQMMYTSHATPSHFMKKVPDEKLNSSLYGNMMKTGKHTA